MVLGGVITVHDLLPKIQSQLDEFRQKTGMKREFKWTKVSKKMLCNYKSLVDLIAEMINNNNFHFKAVVFDTHEFDHTKFSNGDGETTFYKLMYQFIFHKFCPYLNEDDIALVYLDQRSSSYPLDRLKSILNAGIKKKRGWAGDPIRSLIPVDSKNTDLIQVADVLMGAIGFELNGYHRLPAAGAAKCELGRHIAQKFKIRDLTVQTSWGQLSFEVWHFHFRSRT